MYIHNNSNTYQAHTQESIGVVKMLAATMPTQFVHTMAVLIICSQQSVHVCLCTPNTCNFFWLPWLQAKAGHK